MTDVTESFQDNTAQGRYEYHVGAHIVFARYRKEGDTIFIDYVEAPQALRGTGAAGRLMTHVVKIAEEENLKIVPICGYAVSWLKRHKSD